MKINNSSKILSKPVVVFIIAVVVIGVGYGIYAKVSHAWPFSDKTESVLTTDTDQTTTTPLSDGKKTTQESQKLSKSLAAPTLTKSSGNIDSISPDVAVNFICKGQLGVACHVILTDKADNSNKITLPSQIIKDHGRSQIFASFTWQSVTGDWSVAAKIVDSDGNSALSNSQDLIVE